MKRKCFSFENSGHEFRPLDGSGGVVFRLFCLHCARVVTASEINNTADWDFSSLPPESKVDYMTNPPVIIRKES